MENGSWASTNPAWGSRTVEGLSPRAGRLGGQGTAPGATYKVGDDAEIGQTQVTLHLLGGSQRIGTMFNDKANPTPPSVPAQR